MKTRQAKVTQSFVLVLITLFALSFVETRPVAGEFYAHRTYHWTYNGVTWDWSIDIPTLLNDAYRAPSEASRKMGEVNGYMITTQDSFIQSISTSLRTAAAKESYGSYDEASFLLAWVQSLPYTSDAVTTPYDDYPRFPVETLYDNGGDCEDTTYLYMAIMTIWGYGSIMINPPNHLAPGIKGADTLPGYYWEYQGSKYYYAETTGDGWKIGDLPPELQGGTARLFPITVAGYQPNSSSTLSSTPNPNVSNNGQTTRTSSGGTPDILGLASNIFLRALTILLSIGVMAAFAAAWYDIKKRRRAQLPALKSCRYCGVQIDSQSTYCGLCGRYQT